MMTSRAQMQWSNFVYCEPFHLDYLTFPWYVHPLTKFLNDRRVCHYLVSSKPLQQITCKIFELDSVQNGFVTHKQSFSCNMRNNNWNGFFFRMTLAQLAKQISTHFTPNHRKYLLLN